MASLEKEANFFGFVCKAAVWSLLVAVILAIGCGLAAFAHVFAVFLYFAAIRDRYSKV